MPNITIIPGRAKPKTTKKWTVSPEGAAKLTNKQRAQAEKRVYLCDRIAKQFARKCRHVSKEDFYQAAFEGLADAIKGYDRTRKVKFRTYANIRIVGACLDMLRTEGLIRIPRLGRGEPLHFTSIHRVVGHTDVGEAIDYEKKFLPPDPGSTPTEAAESRDNFDAWLRGFDHEERFIVREYVVNERSMKQIGCDLDLSESRVSQKFADIMDRLRERTRDPRYRLLAGYRELATA